MGNTLLSNKNRRPICRLIKHIQLPIIIHPNSQNVKDLAKVFDSVSRLAGLAIGKFIGKWAAMNPDACVAVEIGIAHISESPIANNYDFISWDSEVAHDFVEQPIFIFDNLVSLADIDLLISICFPSTISKNLPNCEL